jgi:hypothetical protein
MGRTMIRFFMLLLMTTQLNADQNVGLFAGKYLTAVMAHVKFLFPIVQAGTGAL